MSKRGTTVILGLSLLAACGGGAEKRIVDQYFGALRAGDNQTLTGFALVQFDQKVERWEVKGVSEETKTEATLPALVKKAKDLEGEVAANKKQFQAYGLENIEAVSKVQDLQRSGKPVPAALSKVGGEVDRYNAKDRELKRAAAEAKVAVEKERQRAARSAGDSPELDTLAGQVIDKRVDVDLTIGGQPKPYVMGLRKYELTGGTGPRPPAKWIVTSITPK
jgi:hypothetical protein